jgi:hypothetical protein
VAQEKLGFELQKSILGIIGKDTKEPLSAEVMKDIMSEFSKPENMVNGSFDAARIAENIAANPIFKESKEGKVFPELEKAINAQTSALATAERANVDKTVQKLDELVKAVYANFEKMGGGVFGQNGAAQEVTTRGGGGRARGGRDGGNVHVERGTVLAFRKLGWPLAGGY